MARSAVMNFMKQQGFTPEPLDRAALRFRGLQFQPTIVGFMILVGILTQSPAIFLLCSALLWLNVLLPAANSFDNVYAPVDACTLALHVALDALTRMRLQDE